MALVLVDPLADDAVDDLKLLHALIHQIRQDSRRVKLLNAYYEGALRLQALGLSLPPEMDDLQTVINWPGVVVDSLEERLDVEGFRLGNSPTTDRELWSWWQYNNLDEESGLGHVDALALRAAYITVGRRREDDGPDDPPLITVDSCESMTATLDPRTHMVDAAVRLYDDNSLGVPQKATLYRHGKTIHYQRKSFDGGWKGWEKTDEDPHGLPALVVPLVNRPRLNRRQGESEMRDVMGIADAACRSITNLQGAQELLAVPSRYVIGASEEDFVDSETGEQVPAWEAYIGRFNALMREDAKVIQLQGADLRNFTDVIRHYADLVVGLTGLPAHYLGITSDNPASADAIRAGESRWIKRAERKQRIFGAAWEQTMRLGMLVKGRDPDQLIGLETVWRDPATPTYAAKADAVVKLVAQRIIPREVAWEEMGYTPEQRDRMRNLFADDPAVRWLQLQADRGASTALPAAQETAPVAEPVQPPDEGAA